jgi:hypothetical protein
MEARQRRHRSGARTDPKLADEHMRTTPDDRIVVGGEDGLPDRDKNLFSFGS